MTAPVDTRHNVAASGDVATWHDPAALDPRWRAPRSGSRRWPVVVALLAALAVIGATFALGGFTERQGSTYRLVPPGSVIRTGPYELTFTHATVQRKIGFTDGPVWTVTAIGTGRLIDADTSASPGSLDPLFRLQDPARQLEGKFTTQTIGPLTEPDPGYGGIGAFSPGLPTEPYRIRFELTPNYQPSGYLQLAVRDMSKRDSTFLQIGEKLWTPDAGGVMMWLPVTVLPHA